LLGTRGPTQFTAWRYSCSFSLIAKMRRGDFYALSSPLTGDALQTPTKLV